MIMLQIICYAIEYGLSPFKLEHSAVTTQVVAFGVTDREAERLWVYSWGKRKNSLRLDAGHGVAWGIYHEEGVEAGKLQKISGANKRCWKYVADGPERTWQFVAAQKIQVPEKEKLES